MRACQRCCQVLELWRHHEQQTVSLRDHACSSAKHGTFDVLHPWLTTPSHLQASPVMLQMLEDCRDCVCQGAG